MGKLELGQVMLSTAYLQILGGVSSKFQHLSSQVLCNTARGVGL